MPSAALAQHLSGNSDKIADMDRDEFYSVSEAAKVLGLGERRIRQLVSEGEVEGERVGNAWQIFRHSVHSFRDEHGVRERPRAGVGLAVPERARSFRALRRRAGQAPQEDNRLGPSDALAGEALVARA